LPAAPQPAPGGHTTQGSGDERRDPAAEAALVKKRVDGFLHDELATRRVESGLVDSYFGTMRREMETAAQNPPAFDPQLVRNFVKSWASAAEAYGTNRAAAESTGHIDSISPLGRAKQEQPGGHLDSLSRTYDQGAALRSFAEGRQSSLMAIVEIHQSAKGKVQGTLLLQSSGNSAFDAHVITSAPMAIAGLADPPASGAGIHPEGIRSTWSFEGRVVYQKKLRDIDLKKDWWYYAVTAPLALVTGSFDETTGDIYTTDFRNPKFACKVKLLRVY
jgi:hypothetical protein